MNKVDVSLIQLDGILTVFYEDYIDTCFNPPIEINLKNKNLYSLYAWKNGNKIEEIAKDDSYQLCSFGYFLPFGVASAFMESNEDYFKRGRKTLFPVFANLKGEFLLVDMTDSNSPVYILSPSLMIVEPEIIFKSLDVMLLCIAVCFEKKAYQFINKELVIDFEMERKVVKKYDDSPFWED